MTENQQNLDILEKRLKENKTSRFNPEEFLESLKKFEVSTKIFILTLLSLAFLAVPQAFAGERPTEDLICYIEQTIDDQSKQTSIACNDGTQVSLKFLLTDFDVAEYSPDLFPQPPAENFQYKGEVGDPNYNCHSFTLQQLETSFGWEFGAGRDAWLENGFETFISSFGEKVAEGTIGLGGRETPIDEAQLREGDVVLYFSHGNILIHSATVISVSAREGEPPLVMTRSKLGEGLVANVSLTTLGWFYELDGEYEEISEGQGIGGGRVEVYRFNSETQLQFVPESEK
jgi:hypothetical protein